MNTVLIVDDDPYVRKFLHAVIANENMCVLEAADGNECVDLYRECSPSVVLIDIIMPEKDGISAIKEIRAQHGQAKIIAMSGGLVFIPEAYLDEAAEVGADFILTKPILRNELISALKNMLGQDAAGIH
jgi:two-component system, chemotaxis family, chemotaxis protein CheY